MQTQILGHSQVLSFSRLTHWNAVQRASLRLTPFEPPDFLYIAKKKKKDSLKDFDEMQQWGSLDFLYIWHFLIPFLHFHPDSGHSFLTRSTLSEAGRSFLKWLHLVTGVPMLMCQHTTKQLRTRPLLGRGDKVMLWTKRCIQTGEKERSGSKCLRMLIFVYP